MLLGTGGATIAIFGIDRVDSGTYDKMRELHDDTVVGIDFDDELIKKAPGNGAKI